MHLKKTANFPLCGTADFLPYEYWSDFIVGDFTLEPVHEKKITLPPSLGYPHLVK